MAADAIVGYFLVRQPGPMPNDAAFAVVHSEKVSWSVLNRFYGEWYSCPELYKTWLSVAGTSIQVVDRSVFVDALCDMGQRTAAESLDSSVRNVSLRVADTAPVLGNAASKVVRLARDIAYIAHYAQLDRAGRPYIEHPQRVAARLSDPFEKAAGLLHDVIEDGLAWSLERLADNGIPINVVEAVDCLTKRAGESRTKYFERVAGNEIAAAVKFADMEDNSNPDRLALLDPPTATRLARKYAEGRAMLWALGWNAS